MEADWEFEVGGNVTAPEAPITKAPIREAPVIDACWPGFIDLRLAPERAWHLPETAQLPALAEALVRLNDAGSPVWTSKCDFWPHLKADEFDSGELDAPPGCSAHAIGCYIDLLPGSEQLWPQPAMAEVWCKQACDRLRGVPLRCCRADLVIRRAVIGPDSTEPLRLDLGITAYLTACGESSAEAERALQAALAALTDAVGCASRRLDVIAKPGKAHPGASKLKPARPAESDDAL
ncbi:MAG: hypothetical protein ABSD44_04270 [Terracidiphilus sp.]